MSNFDEAVNILLLHEGSEFTEDPSDLGGNSRFGITQKTLSEFQGQEASVEEVKNLSRDRAIEIYRKLYWEKLLLDDVSSPALAATILDQAVLAGCGTVVKKIQQIFGIHQDGVMGPVTISKIIDSEATDFVFTFCSVMAIYYTDLCKSNPSQFKFLKGWLVRIFSLLHNAIYLPGC